MGEAAEQFVEIKDSRPRAVRAMLAFIYTGLVDMRAERLETKDLGALLMLADRYEFPELLSACAHRLVDDLDVSSTVEATRTLRSLADRPEVAPAWQTLLRKLRECVVF